MVRVEQKRARTNEGIRSYLGKEWEEIHIVPELSLCTLQVAKKIEWEEVSIMPDRPELTTQVAINLDKELKKSLINCLVDHRGVFAWSPQEVIWISPLTMEYRLNILPDAKLVKQ